MSRTLPGHLPGMFVETFIFHFINLNSQNSLRVQQSISLFFILIEIWLDWVGVQFLKNVWVSAELNLSELKVHFNNQLLNFAPQLHIMDLRDAFQNNKTKSLKSRKRGELKLKR